MSSIGGFVALKCSNSSCMLVHHILTRWLPSTTKLGKMLLRDYPLFFVAPYPTILPCCYCEGDIHSCCHINALNNLVYLKLK